MSESTLNERVAEEIRVMLARRNMSAAELSRRAGLTQRSVSRITTGEKGIDMHDLELIARALEVEVTDLLPRPAPDRGMIRPSSHPAGQPTTRIHRAPDPRPTRTHPMTTGTRRSARPAWTCAGVTA